MPGQLSSDATGLGRFRRSINPDYTLEETEYGWDKHATMIFVGTLFDGCSLGWQ